MSMPPGTYVPPYGQCGARALKSLACRARVTPASSLASPSLHARGCARPSRVRQSHKNIIVFQGVQHFGTRRYQQQVKHNCAPSTSLHEYNEWVDVCTTAFATDDTSSTKVDHGYRAQRRVLRQQHISKHQQGMTRNTNTKSRREIARSLGVRLLRQREYAQALVQVCLQTATSTPPHTQDSKMQAVPWQVDARTVQTAARMT